MSYAGVRMERYKAKGKEKEKKSSSYLGLMCVAFYCFSGAILVAWLYFLEVVMFPNASVTLAIIVSALIVGMFALEVGMVRG